MYNHITKRIVWACFVIFVARVAWGYGVPYGVQFSVRKILGETHYNLARDHDWKLISARLMVSFTFVSMIKDNLHLFPSFATPEEIILEKDKIICKSSKEMEKLRDEYRKEIESLTVNELKTFCDNKGITVKAQGRRKIAKKDYVHGILG